MSINSNDKNSQKQSALEPLKAVYRGFLMGLGMATAHKVVDAVDHKINGDHPTTHNDTSDSDSSGSIFGDFFS